MLLVAGPVDLNENSEQKEMKKRGCVMHACGDKTQILKTRSHKNPTSKLRLETAPNISKDAIRQLFAQGSSTPGTD